VLIVWFHSSPSVIPDGDFVLSASALGIDPPSFGDRVDEARGYAHFRPDRVFIYESDTDDVTSGHFGIAIWATEDKFIYEVEPLGDLSPDPSPVAPGTFACCTRARVIR
jgi:hypothetical protein